MKPGERANGGRINWLLKGQAWPSAENDFGTLGLGVGEGYYFRSFPICSPLQLMVTSNSAARGERIFRPKRLGDSKL